MPGPGKRPSRKFRRRPSNLQQEYCQRQTKNTWLETHIWHAKRFHMTSKWGYMIPEKCTTKNLRCLYRAICRNAILTDISYYNCIQLEGPEIKLLENLKKCTSPDCGLTFGAKIFLNGEKEGHLPFFYPDSYPQGIIGHLSFIWKPYNNLDSKRTLWIWVHPLIHFSVKKCLEKLFKLKNIEECDTSKDIDKNNTEIQTIKTENSSDLNKDMDLMNIKSKIKNVPFDKTPKFVSEDQLITMTLLKDTLNRFQVTGPVSQNVICKVFNLVEIQNNNNKSKEVIDTDNDYEPSKKKIKQDTDLKKTYEKKSKWWQEYYREETNKKSWDSQKKFFFTLNECTKPTDIPSGSVIPLVIGDPRLTMPEHIQKKIEPLKSNFFLKFLILNFLIFFLFIFFFLFLFAESPSILENYFESIFFNSPIWEPHIRDEVSTSKLSQGQINKARSKKIVPGGASNSVIPDTNLPRIPILLVQRSGTANIKNRPNGKLVISYVFLIKFAVNNLFLFF